jgi:hypothetical protein
VTTVYDGDGNRVSETVAGVRTNYLVDTVNPTGYAQVVDELQSGSVTKTYSLGLERIDQNWQPTAGTWQPAFYGYDGHGSVRQLTNSAGAVTDTGKRGTDGTDPIVWINQLKFKAELARVGSSFVRPASFPRRQWTQHGSLQCAHELRGSQRPACMRELSQRGDF